MMCYSFASTSLIAIAVKGCQGWKYGNPYTWDSVVSDKYITGNPINKI